MWLVPIYKDLAMVIVVRKSSQCGITEFAIVDMINMAKRGYSGLYILPTDQWRSTFVPNRIDRCFEETREYRIHSNIGRKDADSKSMKTFYGRNWKFVGSKQRNNFFEFPAEAIIIDEFDLCDHSNLIYALDRLGAAENPQIRKFGNPTISGTGIDKVYDDSDAKIWQIKCDHCNEWQELDWFVNFVDQEDNGDWKLRCPDSIHAEKTGGVDASPVCVRCNKPINRLAQGSWIAQHPDNEVSGYAISKLFADCRNMPVINDLFVEWVNAQGNPTALQRFYNNILGVAFTADGSHFTDTMFDNLCDPNYTLPVTVEDVAVIGVDTGTNLHYHIVKTKDGKEITVAAGHVKGGDYDTLDLICKENKVFNGVIDSQGDLNATRNFVRAHPGWYMCSYSKSAEDIKNDMLVSYDKHTVRVNRTESIDNMFAFHLEKRAVYPKGWRYLDNGDFLKQMLAPTRIYLEPPVSQIGAPGRYVWDEGSKADHHFHARNYCHIAARMSGGVGEGVHIL